MIASVYISYKFTECYHIRIAKAQCVYPAHFVEACMNPLLDWLLSAKTMLNWKQEIVL